MRKRALGVCLPNPELDVFFEDRLDRVAVNRRKAPVAAWALV